MLALVRRARADRITGLGAEVAFFVILSVFPALLVMALALGFLGSILGHTVAQEAQSRVLGALQRVLTSDAQGTIDAVRRLFTEKQTGLLTFSALAAVWSTGRGFAVLVRALGQVYGVADQRSWLRRQAMALGLALGTVLTGAIMLVTLVVGPLLGAGGSVAGAVGVGGAFATAWAWVRVPLLVIVAFLWAATVLHVAPNHQTSWRSDAVGAALTTAWWIVASLGLHLGLAVASTNQVFGVLGGSLILLVWIYLLGLGMLMGGELNAVLDRPRPD
ncbi:MAG: YihY/virulence factor BrkB family protein [Acidimicrobiales bacterium]